MENKEAIDTKSRVRGRPKVSVCVITYNQVDYIGQCLQSIVDQETDFDFEVIVGDDCSTDGTREVIRRFAEQYPKIVKPIFHQQNIGGGVRNYISVHDAAAGEYIAHVDGDDYCLPGKLRSQADFLDRNPECQIVWHRMNILNGDAGEIYPQQYYAAGVAGKRFGIDDVISNITMGLHSSKMYRRWNMNRPSGLDVVDFSENVLQLHFSGGYASFVGDQPLGVYRLNGGISRNAAKIRILVYQWLAYFYANRIGSRSMIFAKLFLMLLSDARRRVPSFSYGASVIVRMSGGILPLRIADCRSRRIPVSLVKAPSNFMQCKK